mgnify:CR=1 FL=1
MKPFTTLEAIAAPWLRANVNTDMIIRGGRSGTVPREELGRYLLEAVRRAVGDDVVIGIDPNTGWSVGDALLAIHAMRQYDLGYIEQPIDRRDLQGLSEIRRQAQGIPVMADEALFTVQDAFALAEARAVDAFCIKLYKLGGLTSARRIAGVAQAASRNTMASTLIAGSPDLLARTA